MAKIVRQGTAGADTLNGLYFTTQLVGGAGNDIYLVDGGDQVVEQANQGIDMVQSSLSHTLAANVENLLLTGSRNTFGTGNNLDNSITGNSGRNLLTGADGKDTLAGGAGSDTLGGGAGDDLLDGGTGSDYALFSGARANYKIWQDSTGTYIRALSGTEGTDKLVNIEMLKFSDVTVSLADALKTTPTTPTTPTPPPTPTTPTPPTGTVYTGSDDHRGKTIVGTTGTDTVSYARDMSYYKISQWGSAWVVEQSSGGMDTLYNVEYLKFADKTYNLATGAPTAPTTPTTPTTPTDPAPTTPTNTAPVAKADSATTNEDTAVTISVLANDTDANSDALKVDSIVTGPSNGTVAINANGTITYTPKANFNGNDSLTYKVSDGKGGTATATIAIAVAAANDAPTAKADTAATTAGKAVTINVLANDTDVDGNALSVNSIVTGPTNGTVTVNTDGTLLYTPKAGFTGADTLTYKVSDGNGGTSNATVTVNVAAAPTPPTTPTGQTYVGSDGHTGQIITGTAGSDTVTYTRDMSYYTITQNGSSFVVTQSNGGGADTLNSIEQIRFADQTYDLSNGVPTPTTPTDPTPPTSPPPSQPSTTPLPTEGMIKASVIQPSSSADIVGFKLTNTTSQANASEYVTFGQSFEAGDLRPGDSLVATINGTKYAVQVDAKTFNDDGSISHAILTLNAPAIAASASVDGMLSKGTAGASGPTLTTADLSGLDVKLLLTMNGTTTTIDAATVLQQAIAAGKVESWMTGSQASEFRATTTIDGGLKATFDIRVYANGEIKTDVIVTNETTFTANPKTYTYDVAIRQDGATVYSESAVQQWTASTWHKEIYKNDAPDVYVTFDTAYLLKSGAILAYDTSIGVSAQAINGMLAALNASDTSLMGSSLLEKYMGMTGGRADIGPLTEWAAMYLISQDPRALEVMLAQADAGGSIPWHFRDEATGDYVRVDLNPQLWIDSRASGAQAIAGGFNPGGGWTPELAHQPSLSYIPYLVTGTRYYLDEVQAQAAFGIAADNPLYRDGANGIEPSGQIRALAWGLRDISDAMFVTPDNDPMQAYFEKILDNNLSYLVKTYITDGTMDTAKELEGYLTGDYRTVGATAPWQQDYLVMALGRIAAQGSDDAAALLGWMTNFVAGRFINGDYGYDPLYGPAYDLYVGGNSLYTTWAQAGAQVVGGLTEMDGYPTWAGGYAAGAKGALATLITETQSADAYEAFGYVISQTTAMVSDFPTNPTFDIAPMLKDGTYLQHDNMWVSNTTSAVTMNGTAANNLLHGGSGSDTINGNGGIDLLYGAAGNDTLNGGDGDDYLFGGSGSDVLNGGIGADFLRGGGGNDTMTGGAGVDTFSVDIREKGANTIADFQVGTDRIEVAHAYGVNATTLIQQILAGATTDGSGNIVLQLAAGNELTLTGIQAGQLTAASLFVSQ